MPEDKGRKVKLSAAGTRTASREEKVEIPSGEKGRNWLQRHGVPWYLNAREGRRVPNNIRKLPKASHHGVRGNGSRREKALFFWRGFLPLEHGVFLPPVWAGRQRCQAKAGTENRHSPEDPPPNPPSFNKISAFCSM